MNACRGAVGTSTRGFTKSCSKRQRLSPYRTFTCSRQLRGSGEDVPYSSLGRGSDYDKRVRSLSEGGDLARCYPRLQSHGDGAQIMPPAHFLRKYGDKHIGVDSSDLVCLSGRVASRRAAGSKLVFLDLAGTWVSGPPAVVQVVCNESFVKVRPAHGGDSPLESIEKGAQSPDASESDSETFKRSCQMIRVGDLISVRGRPYRTEAGQLSVLATQLPEMHAPMLHQLPDKDAAPEAINRRAHVKMLLQPRVRDIMRLRMRIETAIGSHCAAQGLTRVHTPIVGASSGGAAAEPFETRANETGEDRLTLRIAPELYLKRLMVGDMPGVYELGTAFRNEGVDATHNPEFTICEYYKRYATLNGLMADTESLFRKLATLAANWAQRTVYNITPFTGLLQPTLPRKEFIPHLEASLRQSLGEEAFRLPDLEQPSAAQMLRELYRRLGIHLPSHPTLPRLLDDLSSRYLESQCQEPTWIVAQPACLAPLAKSYVDKNTGQHVSARAELFIKGKEYVNCYEEENSPFEQRKKFLQQRALQREEFPGEGAPDSTGADAEQHAPLLSSEENYIEALEWGLAPTGGWGCGVDRLVMLFSGAERIADVLPFGTLNNVVAMGKPMRK